MGEDLFRLISTGLLAAVVLLLLLAVFQLGRLRRSLDRRTDTPAGAGVTDAGPPEDAGTATHESLEEQHPDDADVPDSAVVPVSEEESPAGGATEAAPSEEDRAEQNEVGPYEQDGRWWFRRDDELLVYDEQLERWVDAEAPSSDALAAAPGSEAASEPDPVAHTGPAAEPEPHPLDEAREWTAPERRESAEAPATADDVTSAAPIPEPVGAPTPITEDDGSQGGSIGHWKCPSCGVINGSTAASCRMCFAARP